MNWTDQQLNAINSRNKNLLVAAAAGSGKTAVLVERIVELLENIDIDKMLIVTFTNAAATEMKARIYKRITEKISAAFIDEVEHLERQNILLSGASIMTFHAFCLSVLRRHFAKINLDPRFREADEHELNILKQEVIEDLFEKKYGDNDLAFIKFTDDFGGTAQGDSELYKLIINLHSFSQSRPYPQKWLYSLVAIYENPATFKLDNGETWLDSIKNFALAQAKIILTNARADCLECLKNSIATKTFEDDAAILSELLACLDDWDKLAAKLQLLTFKRFDGGKKLSPDVEAKKNFVKKIRDNYKANINTLREIFITTSTADIIAEMNSLAESVRQLVQITVDFDNAFNAAKRDRNIIDFNDMEHLALKIFNENPNAAQSYRNKFKVIMVDEYQDTNGVQEEIISKIVGSNNLFAVGDVKQSIYRFRNADPTIFIAKYKNFPLTPNCARIDLSTNFRSRPQILNAVNFVFQNTMTENIYEINYDDAAKLNRGANFPSGSNTFNQPPEISIIHYDKKVTTDEVDEYAPDFDKLEIEVQVIANKINSLFRAGFQVWDNSKNAYRTIQYSDIVILFRSIDKAAAQIVEVLQKNNIPAYAADKDGYFRAIEIQTVLCLLKVLDNARQDIPLATVLLSPIGGFSAEDLAALRISDRNSDLFSLISNDIKFQDFLTKINRWRDFARQLSVPELLNLIYRETGYYDYCAKFGRIAQANLRMLIDRAAQYENTAFRGLSRFIQFIKRIKDLGNDLAAARTLSESENVVKVMTVHKSKGLEFPVVFVAGLGKKFNLQDLKNTVIAHRDFGIGTYNTVDNLRVDTFTRQVIAQKIKLEMLAEELRILYVAMTRAKEQLFLTAIDSGSTNKINCPLDWLLKLNLEQAFIVSEVDSNTITISDSEIKPVDEKISVSLEKLPPFESIPAKISVTELKRRLNLEEFDNSPAIRYIYRRPNFLQKQNISGAEFGSLMHSVMQHLNFNGDLSRAGIISQIDELINFQVISLEHADIVKRRADSIVNFFNSDIGRKAVNAQEIYRELPFSYFIDAQSTKIFSSNDRILIQGIIDLLFKFDGKWFLVDYKTDSNNTDDYFRQQYKQQIYYYVQAVESIAKIKIHAQYLYLLGAGRIVPL